MELTNELTELLYRQGAGLVGIGDMRGVQNCTFKTGVAVAVPLSPRVVLSLQNGPTREYYALYHALNSRLNAIVCAGEALLKSRGFAALAQTTDRVQVNEERISPVPHKTAATRAGLGWIGKNGLLVTPQYGCALRLSSLLTDAPLQCGEATVRSRCGACTLCVKACPAHALHSAVWTAGMDRGQIVNVEDCYKKQVEIMRARTGIETDLCGRCFAVCAYTKRYLKREKPC